MPHLRRQLRQVRSTILEEVLALCQAVGGGEGIPGWRRTWRERQDRLIGDNSGPRMPLPLEGLYVMFRYDVGVILVDAVLACRERGRR